MCTILSVIKLVTKSQVPVTNQLKLISRCVHEQSEEEPISQTSSQREKIGPLGWFLLIVPLSAFGIANWQIYRKKQQEELLTELNTRTKIHPIKLPHSLEEIPDLEYHPVHVRGKFLHDKELYIGPRSLIKHGDAAALIAPKGYLVITPLKLSDRDDTILVNRGWVSPKNKDPKTRTKGQVKGEVDVVGLIRLCENRPTFIPASKSEQSWFYRDVNEMSKVTGAAPIFLDATTDFNVPEGPVGGQTRIVTRNENLSYILTSYGVFAGTSYLWYITFFKGILK